MTTTNSDTVMTPMMKIVILMTKNVVMVELMLMMEATVLLV